MLRNVTQAQMTYFQGQENFDKVDFTKYYGYTVGHETTEVSGGYCGVMTTGVMEDCVAYDLISAEGIQQAGGFVGLLQAGVVRFCTAEELALVSGKNYAGGFVARMGKSSILKADDVATTSELGILGDLLTLSLSVSDVFGSHIEDSSLTGTEGATPCWPGGLPRDCRRLCRLRRCVQDRALRC